MVNFTNLATARASQRAREVALRKVLGASRKQLIVQFLGESILVAALAMVVALAHGRAAAAAASTASSMPTSSSSIWARAGCFLPILGLVLLVGAAGGLYPAFYLSRFQPAQVLKANKSSAEAQGSGRLRNVLVVAQFAVSIGLIICTAVIYAQTVYARTADPGYKRRRPAPGRRSSAAPAGRSRSARRSPSEIAARRRASRAVGLHRDRRRDRATTSIRLGLPAGQSEADRPRRLRRRPRLPRRRWG